jgi:hypothetical protein
VCFNATCPDPPAYNELGYSEELNDDAVDSPSEVDPPSVIAKVRGFEIQIANSCFRVAALLTKRETKTFDCDVETTGSL